MGNQTPVPVCRAFQTREEPTERNNDTDIAIRPWTTSAPFFEIESEYSGTTQNVTNASTTPTHATLTDSSIWTDFDKGLAVIITVLCLLGIIGNILNLLVLSSRRMSSDRIGRSMNLGLICLAISDMLFCLIVFPYTFVPKDLTPTTGDDLMKFYYRIYGMASINLFMMCGTWIVMFMSVSRYIGIVHPLKARDSFCTTKMPIIICLMFLTSIIVTTPYYLQNSVLPCTCSQTAYINVPQCENNSIILYEIRSTFDEAWSKAILFYIRWIWPVIADFFPLFLLLFCNFRLIQELRRTSKSRKETCPGQTVKATSNRVTLTLIAVVLMLLIFVSPAEMLKYINPYKSWGAAGYIVANVANVMQLVNFSSNFLLYCAINPKFRAAARALASDMCCCKKHKTQYHRSSSEDNRTMLQTNLTGGNWKSNNRSQTGYSHIEDCKTTAI